jgi:hypothetical protein
MSVSVAGADVSVGDCVSVGGGDSVAARALQEDSSSVISAVRVNSFLIISNSFAWDVALPKGRRFGTAKPADEERFLFYE